MRTDRYGNNLTTSSDAARDAYVDAVDRFLAAEAGAEDGFDRAIAADPDFSLAHLGKARCRQMLADGAGVRAAFTEAERSSDRLKGQERGHFDALALLVQGKVPAAYALIRKHLLEHPRDAMVAQTCMGVFGLIGFSGKPGREAEQLAFTTSLAPHYGDDWWFLGQHAFAQAEVGQIGPATDSIERSLDGNPRNPHSAHVRAHIYYEAGETDAGYAYMDHWRNAYDRSGLLFCHISWHVALWALERGDLDTMWRVIDQDVMADNPHAPPINVLTDAAAIYYRAALAGVDVPKERWAAVSAFASRFFPKTGLAFADVHAALAHAMAGDSEELHKIIEGARGPAGDLVKEFSEAFGAIAAGNWAEAEAHLLAAMPDHARLGGSRAQRDLLEYALLSVLLKQGQDLEARHLLSLRRPLKVSASAVKGLQ